jgi:hypothetical protein
MRLSAGQRVSTVMVPDAGVYVSTLAEEDSAKDSARMHNSPKMRGDRNLRAIKCYIRFPGRLK